MMLALGHGSLGRVLGVGLVCYSAVWSAACYGSPTDARDKESDSAPSISRSEKGMALNLPQAVIDSVRRDFPGYRVPATADLKGAWASEWAKGVPAFAAWGDYDGNRLTDVAILLLGEGEWKFVVLNQVSLGQYKSRILNGGPITQSAVNLGRPEAIVLKTLPKGRSIRIGSNEEAVTLKYSNDAIEFGEEDGALWLFYWDRNDFAQRVFSYE
jgi:hypothetical protein